MAAAQASAATNARLANLAAVAPVTSCEKLLAADISTAVGARTHIDTATEMPNATPVGYCRVTGYVEPAIRFEIHLPLTTWTQRFVQVGCGGLCGMVGVRLSHAEGCYPADHGELVLSSTDMGHEGGNDGQWAEKDYQLRIDFAYRGVHLTTLATKAILERFYGQPAKFSYFFGCSDGGREALMEAQRFPEDFNGIIGGAAAMNFVTQNTFYHGWNALKNMDSKGDPILTADNLPALHRAALNACDAADGLKDGIISDPLNCHVDPAIVQCKGAETTGCLTPAQVQTARDIYAGAHDAQGNKLVLSGPLPGSELAWTGVYIPNAGSNRTLSPQIATGVLKYLAFEKNPPSTYKLDDLQFTQAAFTAATQLHTLYDATDPDLRSFEKHGGKLILFHGLADPHISPLNTIAYYNAMGQTMGQASVKSFARLYLFPGGYHCDGGEGPFKVDLLTPMMAWVESKDAPFALMAAHQQTTARAAGGPRGPDSPPAGNLPRGARPERGENGPPAMPQGKVDRTRPVYPFPTTAKYIGTGSIDDAANFTAGAPMQIPDDRFQWSGAAFYKAGYEKWCTADGASFHCTAKR